MNAFTVLRFLRLPETQPARQVVRGVHGDYTVVYGAVQRLRIMDEAYADYLTGMAALRKRVVGDVKRKLSDSKVVGRPHLEQASPPERPASAARHRRARGRRPRG